MTNAWYQVLSLRFGYVSAAAVLLFVLLKRPHDPEKLWKNKKI